MPSKTILGIVALIIVIAGLAGVAYVSQQGSNSGTTSTSTPLIIDGNATTTRGPGYTIERVSLDTVAQPDLNRKVVFGAGIPPAVQTNIQKHIDDDVALLKADNLNAGAWLDLGVWYHSANDFDAARTIWEFLTKVAPKDATSFENLGRMYHFDTQDFAKAESYFKQSIAINPKSLSAYQELFELYTLSYKTNTTAGVDIIHAAEKVFPAEPGLPLTLAGYYRDHKDYASAKAEFLKALDLARAANNVSLVGSINDQLASLPK